MMRKSVLLCTLAIAASASCFAQEEGRVEITWEEPKSYTDIRPANETRAGFRKRVFANLENYMEHLSEDFPEGYSLSMTVTDVDLAGQVWPSRFAGFGAGAADVRIIDRPWIPRMDFSYSLSDADGNEIKTAEVSLKDMVFQDRIVSRRNSDAFVYEKAMLKDWFGKEFGDQIVKN